MKQPFHEINHTDKKDISSKNTSQNHMLTIKISSTYQHGSAKWLQYQHAYTMTSLHLALCEELHEVVPENTTTISQSITK